MGSEELEGETVTWLRLSTQRVLSPFLDALAKSHGWLKLVIVSPWISEFGHESGTMTFRQMIKRLKDDDAAGYVVTRPPDKPWHTDAIELLKESGKVQVRFHPSLHSKLYVAATKQSDFALLGSANMTRQSFSNREIGVIVRKVGAGAPVYRKLTEEASNIHRDPISWIHHRRKF
jgi:phosphatidylserine/phosphatidylglycerophosphate/cardiolipin synthase-like enzyme